MPEVKVLRMSLPGWALDLLQKCRQPFSIPLPGWPPHFSLSHLTVSAFSGNLWLGIRREQAWRAVTENPKASL